MVTILATPVFSQGKELIVVRESLQMLQATLDNTIASADRVMANRLAEVSVRLKEAQRQIEDVIAAGDAAAKSVIGKATRSAHMVLRDTADILRETRSSTFSDLNNSIASVAQVLDGVPLFKVDPYIAAITPDRIPVDFLEHDRTLRISGYLPGDIEKEISVSINGQRVDAKRSAMGSIVCEVPLGTTLTESSYLGVSVTVPKAKRFWGGSSATKIEDRIYVRKSEPYTCTIRFFRENPDKFVTVKAEKAFEITASTQGGAHNPTENQVLGVEDLLYNTIANAQDLYEVKSATITDAGFSSSLYGGCKHKGPSAKLNSSKPKEVSVSLNAPHVDRHAWRETRRVLISRFPRNIYVNRPEVGVHDQGGTKAVVSLRPTFRLTKKGVDPTVLVREEKRTMGWQPLETKLDIPNGVPWTIHIECAFQDGSERWSSGQIILSSTELSDDGQGVVAEVADGILYISAIDPMDRLDRS